MNTSCQTRCVIPYLNVTVSPNGRVSPCCMSTKQFKTDKNYKYLYEAPLVDFWNSDSRKMMIANLDKYNVDLWNESKFEIIKFLNLPSSSRETLIKFIEEIKLRDNLRNESFREVFPELYQLLKDVYE